MPWLVYIKSLFGPKSRGKGGRNGNGNGLVLKVGCNIEN
jgi:hypothetical protein